MAEFRFLALLGLGLVCYIVFDFNMTDSIMLCNQLYNFKFEWRWALGKDEEQQGCQINIINGNAPFIHFGCSGSNINIVCLKTGLALYQLKYEDLHLQEKSFSYLATLLKKHIGTAAPKGICGYEIFKPNSRKVHKKAVAPSLEKTKKAWAWLLFEQIIQGIPLLGVFRTHYKSRYRLLISHIVPYVS